MGGLGALWRQWLPTSLGSSMLVLERPAVAAAVAHSSSTQHALAAFGIGISVIVVVNAPALALAPFVVALHGRINMRSIRTYTLLIGSLGVAAVAFLAAFPAVLQTLLDPDALTAQELPAVLFALAPASMIVAVRRYLHGRLIACGATRGIAEATGIRLVVSVAFAWFTAPVGSAAAGAFALTLGACTEAVALSRGLRRDAPAPGASLPTAGMATLGARHAPVAATRMLNMAPQLATTIGIAHAAASLPSLVAWPVLYGLLSLFTGPLSDIETVSTAALRRDGTDPNPRRLAVLLGSLVTAGYGLVLLTPLLAMYLAGFSGLTGQPLGLSLRWAFLTLLVPALWVVRGHLRGIVLAGDHHRPLAYGVGAHLAGLGLVLTATVRWGMPGVTCAVLAVLGGVLAETLSLLPPTFSGRRADRVCGPGRVGKPDAPTKTEVVMGTGDKIDNKAEEMKGKTKETVGRATDDEQLEAEGHADQAKSNLKQAGEKIKDVFKS
jgi:uncharacterized protein YjbJ (UPF0337 family)